MVTEEMGMQRLAKRLHRHRFMRYGSYSARSPDPEILVLTITDLGMVRNVTQMGEGWVIGRCRLIPVVRQRNI